MPYFEPGTDPKTIAVARSVVTFGILLLVGCSPSEKAEVRAELESLHACQVLIENGVRSIATSRDTRFLGKVAEATAQCRGGDNAAKARATPWTDWQNYWLTGDASSKAPDFVRQAGHAGPNERGLDGALLDLEYERIELIKFNLFDNNGTYRPISVAARASAGPALKVWPEMRLPAGHPHYADVGGAGATDLQRRTYSPADVDRNLQRHTQSAHGIERPAVRPQRRILSYIPGSGPNELARNRHGDRLGLLQPDPQVISRRLLAARNRIRASATTATASRTTRLPPTATTRKRRSSMCLAALLDPVHDP